MVILVHLINNWQMNPHRKRTLLAALLLSTACIFAVTEDCYTDSYAKAPEDGSAAESPNTCMRVDRGTCWLYPSCLLRSATRERNPADFRDVMMGFRVAKTLP